MPKKPVHGKNTPQLFGWRIDPTNRKYMRVQKYIPAIRLGWNDLIFNSGYSKAYEKATLTYQLSYEIGRAAASHWLAEHKNNRRLWVSQTEIPDFVMQIFYTVKDIIPPEIDRAAEPIDISEDQQISVY